MASVALAAFAMACAPERPRVSGNAHSESNAGVVLQALESGADPHVVQRDVTVSSYCVACHTGYDTNGHPVGRSLADAAAAHPGWYRYPPASPAIVLVNGAYVECSSCHDDGSAGFRSRTVLPENGMCSVCHDMGDGDVASPTVTITSPSDGATVQGTISVQATATDDVSVDWVELWAGPPSSAMTRVSSLAISGSNVSISLPFDTTTMANGPVSLLVRVYDTVGRNADSTISVSVVNPPPDTASPSVAITAPADGASVRGTISVDATATDDVGVVQVELWVGSSPSTADTLAGTVVPTGASATFSLDTATLLDGQTWCVVRAYDAAGNMGNAASSVLIDNTPPTVAISSPADGASVRGTTTIAATAADANALARVDFYVDGAFLATSTSAPYTATWEPPRRSDHTLTAVATDLAGNVATSAPVAVRAK
jgi:hypothetical protein